MTEVGNESVDRIAWQIRRQMT